MLSKTKKTSWLWIFAILFSTYANLFASTETSNIISQYRKLLNPNTTDEVASDLIETINDELDHLSKGEREIAAKELAKEMSQTTLEGLIELHKIKKWDYRQYSSTVTNRVAGLGLAFDKSKKATKETAILIGAATGFLVGAVLSVHIFRTSSRMDMPGLISFTFTGMTTAVGAGGGLLYGVIRSSMLKSKTLDEFRENINQQAKELSNIEEVINELE